MMGFLRRLGGFILARAQERSTVAGAVAVATTLLGLALPGGVAPAIVNAVVAVAGVVAMMVPGGR